MHGTYWQSEIGNENEYAEWDVYGTVEEFIFL